MSEPERWAGAGSDEPPPRVLHVRDRNTGNVMDRVGDCEFCPGSEWRWRHNGNADCWMDMDGIGPFEEWGSIS